MKHSKLMFPEYIYYDYDILWSYYLSQLLCNFCNKCRIKLHAVKNLTLFPGSPNLLDSS